MNLRMMISVVGLALLFSVAIPLRAQTGCTDSPEGPTLLLALLAGAGVLAAGVRGFFGRKR